METIFISKKSRKRMKGKKHFINLTEKEKVHFWETEQGRYYKSFSKNMAMIGKPQRISKVEFDLLSGKIKIKES